MKLRARVLLLVYDAVVNGQRLGSKVLLDFPKCTREEADGFKQAFFKDQLAFVQSRFLGVTEFSKATLEVDFPYNVVDVI